MLLLTQIAFAKGKGDKDFGPGPDFDRGDRINHHLLIEKLNLSDEQAEQMETLFAENKKNISILRSQMKIKREELKILTISDDNVDLSVIKTKLQEIAAIDVEIELSRFKIHNSMNKILTDKQKNEFKKFMIEEMHNRKDKMDKNNKRDNCSDCDNHNKGKFNKKDKNSKKHWNN